MHTNRQKTIINGRKLPFEYANARARAKMKERYHEKILTFEYIAWFFCCEM